MIETKFENRVHLALAERVNITRDRRLRADQDAKRFGGRDREVEGGETLAGFVAVLRVADDLDEFIQVAEREKECFEQLCALFGFA